MDNTYPKATGSAGSKGAHFQLDLLSIFLLNALRWNIRKWRLSTENKMAGKFDDLVFELSDGSTILLQAKHKENKKITVEQLLSTNSKNDDFSLPKYFLSYLEIRNTFPIKFLIICTNTQFDAIDAKFIKQNSITKESLLHYKNGTSFYSFSDSITPDLIANAKIYYKNNSKGRGVSETMITEENARTFLKHLQIYAEYPSGNDLKQIIGGLLFDKSISKLLDGISYLLLHQKIKDWFEQPKGEYLTESRTKAIFCEIQSEKYLEVLANYKVSFDSKDIGQTIVSSDKRIFHVVAERGLLLYLLNIYYNLYHCKTKIMVVGCDYSKDIQEEIIKAFQLPQYTFLIIASDKFQDDLFLSEICCTLKDVLESRQYKKVIFVTGRNNKFAEQMKSTYADYYVFEESLTLEDLSEDTQDMFLHKSIVFQGKNVSLFELFPWEITEEHTKSVTSDVLEKLLIGEEIEIGMKFKELEEGTSIYYLDRKFEGLVRRTWHEYLVDKLPWWKEDVVSEKDICGVNDKMIVISDNAGMGKTTVLNSLAMKIKQNNPRLWVIRIELNQCTDILRKCLLRNKPIHIFELINLNRSNQIADKFEKFVFSLYQKVILMLDGVDEISPDYTQLILDLLLQCQKEENFRKVFVTTRPHMAKKLEDYLYVKSLRLVPLTEKNQIDFLKRYRASSLKLASAKINKCKQYAKILINKVPSWMREWYHEEKLVASPLHAKILAEVFSQNSDLEDWQGCKEYVSSDDDVPKLPKTMNIVNLYEKFIEKKRDIFIDKGNPAGNTTANKALMDQFEECLTYHKILASKLIFGESENFSFFTWYKSDVRRDLDEIILKIGIMQKLHDQLVFIHRTFAEYFVAESIFKELQFQNRDIRFQSFLIDEILLESKYQVIRKYLNNFLYNQIPYLSNDMFNDYMSLVDSTNNFDLIHQLAEESNYEVIRFVLHLTKFKVIPRKMKKASIAAFLRSVKKQNTLNNIKYGDGIDIKHNGLTALHHAVFDGSVETVRFLVEMGADVNCGSEVNLKALNIYDWSISRAVFQCYSKYKKEKDPCMPGGNHPALHFAVVRNWPHVIELLLNRGAEIDISDNEGNTAVHFAAMNNYFDIFQLLLNHGANICIANKLGKTAFHFAAEVGSYDTVEFFVCHGININIIDKEGNTVLHTASYRNDMNMATFLVNHGCNINAVNEEGNTALHFAVLRHNYDLIKLLVEQNVDVNIANKDGDAPLHLASLFGSFNIIEVLMGYDGVDKNVVDKKGNTALHLAISQNHHDIVSKLVEGGVDINVVNVEGNTPLHFAAEQKYSNTVSKLIEAGVDINAVNMQGNTALHLAVDKKYPDTVYRLIQGGAVVNISNKVDETPMIMAKRKHYGYIVAILEIGLVTDNYDNCQLN